MEISLTMLMNGLAHLPRIPDHVSTAGDMLAGGYVDNDIAKRFDN